jgi:hypothetical protein
VTAPEPSTTMIESAYCTTRSSRCSEHTIVSPRSPTSLVRAARTSSAACGIERRGGLVQHEHPRLSGQHGAQRNALALPGAQGGDRPVAKIGQTQKVECVLDPAAHDVWRQAKLLHGPGQFVLDHVGDKAGVHPLR